MRKFKHVHIILAKPNYSTFPVANKKGAYQCESIRRHVGASVFRKQQSRGLIMMLKPRLPGLRLAACLVDCCLVVV